MNLLNRATLGFLIATTVTTISIAEQKDPTLNAIDEGHTKEAIKLIRKTPRGKVSMEAMWLASLHGQIDVVKELM